MFEILLDLLSPHRQPLFYFLFFIFDEKKVNLGNNPEMGYDTNNQAKHA
jgi:hypothetical protein